MASNKLIFSHTFKVDEDELGVRMSHIGSGGFGTVYLYKKGDKYLAIKSIPFAKNEALEKSIYREVDIVKYVV